MDKLTFFPPWQSTQPNDPTITNESIETKSKNKMFSSTEILIGK